MNNRTKIFIAGGTGLVGSNLISHFIDNGFAKILAPTRASLDLLDKNAVVAALTEFNPDIVVIAAGRVGGIDANSKYPGEFLYQNIMIQTILIDACKTLGVSKVICFGSACMYPRNAPQPVQEKDLLTGRLEPTNESYAIAKLAGVMMCQAYQKQYGLNCICLIPTNLYGPGDNFDLESGHVIPSLLRRFHHAKQAKADQLEIWGSGKPRREFLHVKDLASAILFSLSSEQVDKPMNVGSGVDISICDLAVLIKNIVGFEGDLVFNTQKPDGMPLKMLDSSKFRKLGWQPSIALKEGLIETYQWLKLKYQQ